MKTRLVFRFTKNQTVIWHANFKPALRSYLWTFLYENWDLIYLFFCLHLNIFWCISYFIFSHIFIFLLFFSKNCQIYYFLHAVAAIQKMLKWWSHIFCIKLQLKYFNSLEEQWQCEKSSGFDNSCKKIEGKRISTYLFSNGFHYLCYSIAIITLDLLRCWLLNLFIICLLFK